MDEVPFAVRLKLSGLTVSEADAPKLEEQVARLDRAAETVRQPHHLLGEPAASMARASPLGASGSAAVTKTDIAELYRGYIACLNRRDWTELGRFVHEDAHYNGERIGLTGYRQMLEADHRAIPDLHFEIDLLVADPPHVASRLRFDCTPEGVLFGLPVNGRRVSFTENVFYEFRDERIQTVWSIIDKAAIESQLRR